MLVKFHTDSTNSLAGFRMKYSKRRHTHYDEDESKGRTVGVVIGSGAGIVALFVLVLVACAISYNKRNSRTSRASPPRASMSNLPSRGGEEQPQHIFMVTRSSGITGHDNPLMFAQPPPYSEVVKHPEWIMYTQSPPPYEEGGNFNADNSNLVMGDNSNLGMGDNSNSNLTTQGNSNLAMGGNSNLAMGDDSNSNLTTQGNSNLVLGGNSNLDMAASPNADMEDIRDNTNSDQACNDKTETCSRQGGASISHSHT
ncbi:homeobox protein 4-like [Gigantopelta aegis]|uniref:homeobox protein 4-like n=1 Tax=Gigantopelta aegis TaxID=1735272 RepID=UPI001B88DB3D|nr:homeobox protein 4-like [Gigantopelta aegis]